MKENSMFSDRLLSQKLERTDAKCNASFVEARARLTPESGAEWIEIGGAYALFDGAESPLTQTFGLGIFDEITNGHLDEIEAFFKRHNAPVFHEVSPMADASLLNLLNERGYQPVELSSVMFQTRSLQNLPNLPVNENIKTRITNPGEEKLWAKTSAAGWATEMDGFADFMFAFGQISAQCAGGFPFIAAIDQKPIATGMLFMFDGVANLAGASTVLEGRSRGAQTALLNARLQFAHENGCDLAMMCALPGSQSQKNAQKNGFQIAYTRTKWKLKS
jgi:hypothetical protein